MTQHDEKHTAEEVEAPAGAAQQEATEARDPLGRAPGWGAIALMAVIGLAMLAAGVIFAEPLRTGYERARSALLANGSVGEKEGAGEAGAEADEGLSYFTCGMHPWVVLPEPGTCPVCQMDLTPLDPGKFTGEIAIDPVVVQNMGVRVEEVTEGSATRTIRTVGTVDYDETRVRDVNLKVGGWIEKLHVDYRGAAVAEGEPLFELYSPQLYEAQQEYLLAWRHGGGGGGRGAGDGSSSEHTPAGQTEKDGSGGMAGMSGGSHGAGGSGMAGSGVAGSLLESARTRLQYLDVTDQQIEELQQRGEPSKTMTIRSPHGGTVIDKHATEGMKVDSGMRVYRIADLSRVWVMATLYEQQLPYVREGQRAEMRLAYVPGRTFEGEVIQVYPFMKEGTRQVRVRLEFENPDGILKPGMYANVELQSKLAEQAVLVSDAAVIDTGERQVAFVSRGEGKFEPRELKLGARADGGRVRVLEGLKPGEKVVTSGQFLLDSEARMREALAKMIRGEPAAGQAPEVPEEGSAELDALPGPAAEQLTTVLEAYLRIGETLAGDSAGGLTGPAQRIAESIEALREVEIEGHPRFWHERTELTETVHNTAAALAEGMELAEARRVYAELSAALAELMEATGVPAGHSEPVQRLHCPMYPEDGESGSVWLQPAGDVRNPFFGARMLRCFDERTTLPTAGGDAAEDATETNDTETSGDRASSSSADSGEGGAGERDDERSGAEQ